MGYVGGVAELEHDGVDREPESFGEQESPRRGVCLPLVVGAVPHQQAHLVVFDRDGHRRPLAGPVHRRAIDPHRQTDPEETIVVTGPTGGLLGAPRVVADARHRSVEAGAVVRGVVGDPGRAAVGERLDEVAAAQVDRVDAELDGSEIDEAFEQGARLGPSGAAVGAHRRGVGQDGARPAAGALETVRTGEHRERCVGDERAHHRVRPGVAEHVRPDPAERAVRVDRERALLQLPATVRHAHEVLAARLHPDHGLPESSRERGDDDRLRGRLELATEPAPDVRCADPHERRSDAEALGDGIAQVVHPLGRGPQDDTVAVGDRVGAVGLHRRGCDTLVHEPTAHDEVGPADH